MKTYNQSNNFDSQQIDNTCPKVPSSNYMLRKVLVGVFFLIVGVVIIGHSLGFFSSYLYHLIISWQMLLIAIGILNILSVRHSLSGVILVVIGGVFLLPRILILPFSIVHLTFPIVLVAVGLFLIVRAFFKPNHEDFHKRFDASVIDYNDDYINEKYVFGGTNMHVISQNFKGGKIEAVFGGGKIDLTGAQLSTEGQNILELELVFGGLEIVIPNDWKITIRTNSVFGAIVEKQTNYQNVIDPTKELIIIGKTVFGGGEIKRI